MSTAAAASAAIPRYPPAAGCPPTSASRAAQLAADAAAAIPLPQPYRKPGATDRSQAPGRPAVSARPLGPPDAVHQSHGDRAEHDARSTPLRSVKGFSPLRSDTAHRTTEVRSVPPSDTAQSHTEQPGIGPIYNSPTTLSTTYDLPVHPSQCSDASTVNDGCSIDAQAGERQCAAAALPGMAAVLGRKSFALSECERLSREATRWAEVAEGGAAAAAAAFGTAAALQRRSFVVGAAPHQSRDRSRYRSPHRISPHGCMSPQREDETPTP